MTSTPPATPPPDALPSADRPDWRNLPPIAAEEHDPFVAHLWEGGEDRAPWTVGVTFLQTFDACRRAAFLRLKHGGGGATHQLVRGSVFHLVAERLTRQMIDEAAGRPLTAEDEAAAFAMQQSPGEAREWIDTHRKIAPEVGAAELEAVFREHPELVPSSDERDFLRQCVFHWCVASFIDPERILGVEMHLSLKIGPYTVRGKLDLVHLLGLDYGAIEDYKTQRGLPDATKWRTTTEANGRLTLGGDVQAQLYALLLAFGVDENGDQPGAHLRQIRVSQVFPAILLEEGLATKSAEFSREQLATVYADLAVTFDRLGDAVHERKWQPLTGSHCARCPAEGECPLPYVLRPDSDGAAIEWPEALRLGVKWKRLKDRMTSLKRALKAAAEREGWDAIPTGEDTALVFIDEDATVGLKKGAIDTLRVDVEAAQRYGEPLDFERHLSRRSPSTKFDERNVERYDARREERRKAALSKLTGGEVPE